MILIKKENNIYNKLIVKNKIKPKLEQWYGCFHIEEMDFGRVKTKGLLID